MDDHSWNAHRFQRAGDVLGMLNASGEDQPVLAVVAELDRLRAGGVGQGILVNCLLELMLGEVAALHLDPLVSYSMVVRLGTSGAM